MFSSAGEQCQVRAKYACGVIFGVFPMANNEVNEPELKKLQTGTTTVGVTCSDGVMSSLSPASR